MSFLSKEGKTILELMKRGTLFYSNQMVPYTGSSAGRININIGNSSVRKRYSKSKSVRKSKRKLTRTSKKKKRISNVYRRRRRLRRK